MVDVCLPGGVLFIEQVSLSVPDSMASSMSSPTDSGLDTCSKATSREDLTDLDQSSSVATTPGTATSPSTEPGRLDAQVGWGWHWKQLCCLSFCAYFNYIWWSSSMFILCFCFPCQSEGRQVDRAQSASVESIPEVLEDGESVTEHSDSASLHDMDYVNPRGVRFTPQQTQRDGEDGEPSHHRQYCLDFTLFHFAFHLVCLLMSLLMFQHVSTHVSQLVSACLLLYPVSHPDLTSHPNDGFESSPNCHVVIS